MDSGPVGHQDGDVPRAEWRSGTQARRAVGREQADESTASQRCRQPLQEEQKASRKETEHRASEHRGYLGAAGREFRDRRIAAQERRRKRRRDADGGRG